MIKVPQAMLDMLKHRRESHKNAPWRQPLSGDNLARWQRFDSIRNRVQIKGVFGPLTNERLLPEDIHDVPEAIANGPRGNIIHMRPRQSARVLSLSSNTSINSNVERTYTTRNSLKVVRFKPNQTAKIVNLAIQTEVFKARAAIAEAEQGGYQYQDQDSVIDLLDDAMSVKSKAVSLPEKEQVGKKKKKYKLDAANDKAKKKVATGVPKNKQKQKQKKKPDERMWRMSRARKQMIFLLECEEVSGIEWKFLVRGNSGLNYSITIGKALFCTCPDFNTQKKPCKHLYYITNYVANLANLFESNPGSIIISDQVLWPLCKGLRQRLTMWVSTPQVTQDKLRKLTDKLRGCQICFKRLGKADYLEKCAFCYVKFHSVCIKSYRQFKGTCPICKQLYQKALLTDTPKPMMTLTEQINHKYKTKAKARSNKSSKPEQSLMDVRKEEDDDPLAFLDD